MNAAVIHMLPVAARIEVESFFTVCEQTEIFLLSVIMGAALGVVYDVFRALRVIFPLLKGKTATVICDIIYMLICGAAVFVFSLVFARGEIRGFYWLGAFLGALIYMLTAGTVVMGIIRAVFGTLYAALKRLWKMICRPFGKISVKFSTKKDYNFVSNAEKMYPNCKK